MEEEMPRDGHSVGSAHLREQDLCLRGFSDDSNYWSNHLGNHPKNHHFM